MLGKRSGRAAATGPGAARSEEHTSELQSHSDLVCRLLLEKKNLTNALLGDASENVSDGDGRRDVELHPRGGGGLIHHGGLDRLVEGLRRNPFGEAPPLLWA